MASARDEIATVADVAIYSKNVKEYEKEKEEKLLIISDESAPIALRMSLNKDLLDKYESLKKEFLSIYPGRSTDPIDYYQISSMARPPEPPSYIFLESGFSKPFAPPSLSRSDSVSQTADGVPWYERQGFSDSSDFISHQANVPSPLDPAVAFFPNQGRDGYNPFSLRREELTAHGLQEGRTMGEMDEKYKELDQDSEEWKKRQLENLAGFLTFKKNVQNNRVSSQLELPPMIEERDRRGVTMTPAPSIISPLPRRNNVADLKKVESELKAILAQLNQLNMTKKQSEENLLEKNHPYRSSTNHVIKQLIQKIDRAIEENDGYDFGFGAVRKRRSVARKQKRSVRKQKQKSAKRSVRKQKQKSAKRSARKQKQKSAKRSARKQKQKSAKRSVRKQKRSARKRA